MNSACIAKRTAILLMASGLLLAICAVPAFAAGSLDTPVKLQVDQDQISANVPTDITFSVNGAGEFTAPTASATKIENQSQFPIHVAKIKCDTTAAAAGHTMNLVKSDALTGNTTNTFWAKAKPNAGTEVELADYATEAATPVGTDWNIAQNASLELTCSGKIINSDVVETTPTQVATITWTIASGDAPTS